MFSFFYPLQKSQVFKNALRRSTKRFKKTQALHLQTMNKTEKPEISVRSVHESPTPYTSGFTYDGTVVYRDRISGVGGRYLTQRLKKWLKLSVICVISDYVTATTIAIFLLQFTPGSLIRGMFLWHDSCMLINNISLTSYFNDSKTMFFPYKNLCYGLYKKIHKVGKS